MTTGPFGPAQEDRTCYLLNSCEKVVQTQGEVISGERSCDPLAFLKALGEILFNNIDALKDVSEDGTANLNAYGTCKLWTPLHVASFYGSAKVTKYLLNRGVVFNSMDRDGKTPLNLAEENGHVNVAKLILRHYGNESVLPDTRTELRNLPREDDPKMSSLEAAVNCKNVGNKSYKNNNFKSAFKLYSRGIELCPDNHPQLVILLSNRAQVLIAAKAYNLALRWVLIKSFRMTNNINDALGILRGHY